MNTRFNKEEKGKTAHEALDHKTDIPFSKFVAQARGETARKVVENMITNNERPE